MNDELIVTYDNYHEDKPVLCIARKYGGAVRVLKIIQGDEAFGIYHYLTDCGDLKSARDIPKKVVCDGDDESDYVYCPCCNEILGTNESVYDDFCDNHYDNIYCCKCGQCLTWE